MYASVVIDNVLANDDKIFDYCVPDSVDISIGSRVLVPFGPRSVEGFVLDLKNTTDVEGSKLKSITRALDGFTAIKPEFISILEEVCRKFKLRKIDVLRLFVPSPLRGGKASVLQNLYLVNKFDENITREHIKEINPRAKAQRALLETFIGDPVQKLTAVTDKTSAATVNALIAAGYIVKEARAVQRTPTAIDLGSVKRVTLTDKQREVVNTVLAKSGKQNVFVLHGVTGSGKTEVYMHVIEEFLKQGKSAIMLVPEIGLTPQVLANFRARFGDCVAILHSGLSTGERYDEWLRLHTGEARIAIGARSAIFAPVENVGVIIIDEEHDGSYFAESNPRFWTHDIAKIRCAYNGNCALILGSATPSIETSHNAMTGEYKLLRLERRVNNLQMPTIEVVDMAAELRSGNGSLFSRAFMQRLKETIDAGNQAMIFLNRRGYTSFVMCKNCGWVARCENCDVSLVYHKEDNQLKCHYCQGRWTPVTRCPKCDSTYLKMGATGTQKVVEELNRLLGEKVPIFRMDADNTRTKDALVDILNNFSKSAPSVLVGTQMIAKGHHFPKVALVGIIDADNSLHFSDYRAAERTFALITQVAGRAGRAETGHVVLQTYMPNHYVYRLAANYDYAKFFEKELNTRTVTKYPPFTTIVRVLVTGEADTAIKNCLEKIMNQLRTRQEDFVYIGAMKSPLGRVQNKFRYQILMRFPRHLDNEMLEFIDSVVKKFQPKNVQIFLEINPQNLS